MSSTSITFTPDNESNVNILESSIVGKLLPGGGKKHEKCSSTYVPHNRLSRYTTALSNLVPVRFRRVPGSEIPIDKIGLFSNVSVGWLSEYVSAGWKNRMVDKSLPIITNAESCQQNGSRIDALWHAHIVERGQAGASVPRIAWKFVQTRVIVGSLIYFLGMILALCSPILLLQRIIAATDERIVVARQYANMSEIIGPTINSSSTESTDHLTNITKSMWHVIMMDNVKIYTHVAILIIAEITSYFLIAWSASMNLRTATRLRSACLALAYKKLVRSSVRFKAPVHHTLSYFVPDSKILYELITNGPQIFTGPLILTLSSLFIWYTMGHWALIGVAVLFILYLSLIISAYLVNGSTTRAMDYSLKRLSTLEELINNIFLAKVAQWDKRFIMNIRLIRKKELAEMKFGALSEGCSLCIVHIIPIVAITAITMSYLLTHKHIVCGEYIPCLVLIFLNVKHSIRSSWLAMSSISRGIASLNKLKTILMLKDGEKYTDKPIDKNLAITINNGHFSWDSEGPIRQSSHFILNGEGLSYFDGLGAKSTSLYELTDVNFYVPKGKLIGVCGTAGSGKTSLLLAILGQLNLVNGHLAMDGSTAYVPDNSSLFEGTLKENIIMGEPFNSSWYYKTIQACHLAEDIGHLPGSDDTDVAQVDFSLMQKQKIALARAIFTNKDINLVDNPLKDVDLLESLEIFQKAILQILGGKTVILVSDRIQFLSKCDTIYMMESGKIIDQGTHNDLLLSNKSYVDLLKSFEKKNREKSKEFHVHGAKQRTTSTSIPSASILNLVSREDPDSEVLFKNTGIKSQIIYQTYDNENGKCLSEIVSIMSLVYSIPIAAAPLIFFYIVQQTLTNTTHIAIILASLVGFIIVASGILMIIYKIDTFNAAKSMHERWLRKIYRAHLSVFSTISSSILLNIFSQNLQEVDYILPKLKITTLMNIGISVTSVIILGILSPWLLIPTIFFIIGSIIYKLYIRNILVALDESRMESITPIYNYAVNTINERVLIQAYRKEREFAKKFYKYCNTNASYDFMMEATKLWIEYRIKLLSAIFLAAVIIISTTVNGLKERYEILGLAFICCLQLTQSMIYLIEAFIDADRGLRTVGFADNYMQNLPQEIKDTDDHRREWPLIPSIHFQNVLLTNYSTNCEPLNFSIYAGEKVAIYGSNPETKRDLAKALLQFEEVFSGNILVGSMNIVDIYIDTLRQHVDYIPAIPVFFSGSIRYNLEPNNRRPNKDVMAILQRVNLWEKISKLENKLDTDANSVFFSITEKKLLLLARIYLNSSSFSRSIIIMEEIGPEPEIINGLLQDMFKEFTVIVLSNEGNWSAQRIIRLQNQRITEVS